MPIDGTHLCCSHRLACRGRGRAVSIRLWLTKWNGIHVRPSRSSYLFQELERFCSSLDLPSPCATIDIVPRRLRKDLLGLGCPFGRVEGYGWTMILEATLKHFDLVFDRLSFHRFMMLCPRHVFRLGIRR